MTSPAPTWLRVTSTVAVVAIVAFVVITLVTDAGGAAHTRPAGHLPSEHRLG